MTTSRPETTARGLRVEHRGAGAVPRVAEARLPQLRDETLLATLAEVARGLPDGECFSVPEACADARCGACTVLVQGRPRRACTTRLGELLAGRHPVRVAPLEKLPPAGGLFPDRSRLLSDLSARRARLPAPGEAPGSLPGLERCTGCGACLEACPEYGPGRAFVGPAVLAQVERARRAPDPDPGPIVDAILEPGGLADCGHSEACIEVCPAGVPIVTAIRSLSRAATRRLLGVRST